MSSYPLSLQPIVDVSSVVEAGAISAPLFNSGCIIGNSGRIHTTGSNSRIRQYSSTSAMFSDGFLSTDPEFLAAQLYFSPAPTAPAVYIGAQDPTAILTAVIDPSAAGTGYVVGDVLTAGGAGTGATFKVTAIGAEGAISTLQMLTQGTGYAVATGVALTGGTGTAAELNISVVGETPLQAVTACRLANANWYAVMVCGSTDTDNEAIASYVQSASPQTIHFYGSQDTSASANSIFAQLQTQTIGRSFGHASTTQSAEYPNNVYVAAADMGVAMGLNTGLPASAFTMMFRSLPGVAAEPLTQSQVTNLQAQNANLLLNYANGFTFLSQGKVASGQFLDIVMGIDMLLSQIQVNVMNLFVGLSTVPQTNPGEGLIRNVIDQACAAAATRGFIAPGVWAGNTVGSLTAGTSLPKGYLIQAQSFTTQSAGDQQARKGMPITVSIITANSIQSISIGVTVQV